MTQELASGPNLQVYVPHALAQLESCFFSGGISASGGLAGEGESDFGFALFGRDSLTVYRDTMRHYPQQARAIFSQLAAHQGVEFNSSTEEEPWKLPHQVAKGVWNGVAVPESVMADRAYWAKQWGVDFTEEAGFTVYNTVDAQPLYIVALAEYVSMYGSDVLNDMYWHEASKTYRAVGQAAKGVMHWMTRTVHNSTVGLLEVKTHNPLQTSWSGVMRDGGDSYFHPGQRNGNGKVVGPKPVNRKDPIAYVEVQGLAASAFELGTWLFPDDPDVKEWQHLAGDIPKRAFELFRMDHEGTLAAALDRDDFGRPRQVQLVGTAAMEVMRTRFCASLGSEGIELTRSMTKLLFDWFFMTPAGARMLSLAHLSDENGYCAYQGTGVVWPVTQRAIAEGLRAQGLHRLGYDLGTQRFGGGIIRLKHFPEFIFVNAEGHPHYYPLQPEGGIPGEVIVASCMPARSQGWTLSAFMAEAHTSSVQLAAPGTWQHELEIQCLAQEHLAPPALLDPSDHRHVIDLEAGRVMATTRYEELGATA